MATKTRTQYPLDLNEREKAMLKELAEHEGMTMAGFLRYVIKSLATSGMVTVGGWK